MASTDAMPIPKKNVAYRVTFPIFDADGDLVSGAASLDSEVSKDAGTFADCTNEATEIATSSGMYYLDLTATEMNADTVAIIVKTATAGAKTTPIVLYPVEDGDIPVNATQISGDTTAADNLELFTENALGADNKILISTDAQDLSTTLDVNTKTFTTTLDFTATMKASVNTEVDNALDTAIPGSPTADSINERVKAIDDKLPAGSIGDATSANQTTILNRIGDFAGTGLNTLKGFFQALFRKDAGVSGANLPSEINEIENTVTGNYDATTDSVEAIRDTAPLGTTMRGTDDAFLAASAPTNFSSMGIETDGHVHADLKEWLGTAPSVLTSGDVKVTLDGETVTVGTNNDKTGYALSAAGVDAILDDAITEPSARFAWASATLRNIIAFIGALAVNKTTETATTKTLRNDADSANITTWTISADATTVTHGEAA